MICIHLNQLIKKVQIGYIYLMGHLKQKYLFKMVKEIENKDDPVFFAVIRKSDNKAIGLTSFLRINIKFG